MLRAVVLALAIGLGAVVAAQSQHDHNAPASPPQAGQSSPAQADMGMHGRMMAEMKAADARLTGLVDAMNAAKGEARVEALVKVVNELAGQHKAMHGRMATMPMMGSGMMKK
jgi:hypothetical protein